MAEHDIRYGATPEDWDHFCLLLGPQCLLPVVSNTNARISPASSIEDLGKIPSRYNREGNVAGFPDWPEYRADHEDVAYWAKQPDYGIAIQARVVRAFDIDVPDLELAKEIKKFIVTRGYRFPARIRPNSGKCLFAFLVKGELRKRTVKVEGGLIELLADDQQFIAVGMHPSGVRYQWATEDGNLPEEFPEISLEELNKLWAALVEKFGIAPPTEAGARRQKGDLDPAKVLADPVTLFLADNQMISSFGREGQAYLECPWKEEHTTENGETETTYFPAGTRGYQQGHFKCLHAHCANRTDQDFLTKIGYYLNDFEDVSTPEDEEAKTKRPRYKPYTVSEYERLPRMKWIIKNLLPRGETMTYGASGAGKSFIMIDMLCRVALGMEWNGRKVERARCTYICTEGQGSLYARLRAWCTENDVKKEDLDDWFCIISDTPNLRNKDDVKELATQINSHFGKNKCDLICVDTFAQVTAGTDENSAKEVGEAMRNAKWLSALTGAAYNLMHHTGKDEDKGARGSSLLKGQMDAMFCVSRKEKSHTFWVDKMKDGPDNFGYDFALETVTVGVDDDGEPVTSCVIKWLGSSLGKKKKSQTKLGVDQQVVFDAWQRLGGGNALAAEVIKEAMRAMPHDGSGKKDSRHANAVKGLNALAAQGMFSIRDNIILVDLDA